jgi:hypothetical protein
MAEIKTKVNDHSVEEFIDMLPDEVKRQDSLALLKLYTKVTGHKAKMWGSSIIGFDKYHYKSERSSQEGDWPLAAFSPRKQTLTLYVMSELVDHKDLLGDLGKHKTSVACLYINKLADVDMKILEKIVERSYKSIKKQYS